MSVLLWIVFIFFILAYALRLFLRYGMPWLLGRMMKQQQDKFNQGFNQQQGYTQAKKEGEVEINIPQNKKQSKDDNFGEYIDFEEDV